MRADDGGDLPPVGARIATEASASGASGLMILEVPEGKSVRREVSIDAPLTGGTRKLTVNDGAVDIPDLTFTRSTETYISPVNC